MKYAKLLILYVLICIIYVSCDSKGTLEGSINNASLLSDKSDKVNKTNNMAEIEDEVHDTDKPDDSSADNPQDAIESSGTQIPDLLIDQMNILLNGGEISLPENYSLLDYCEGDLNADKLNDAVIAIEQAPGEYAGSRLLYVFINDKGTFKLSHENEKILLGSQEGGVLGDPYTDIFIKNGKLYVSDYGGSSQRWAHDYVFGYHEEQFTLSDIIRTDFDINEGLYTRYEYNLLEKRYEIFEGTESSYENNLMECVDNGRINTSSDITFKDAYAFLEVELLIEQ